MTFLNARLLDDPIQLLQFLLWLAPVIVIITILTPRGGRVWNIILLGYFLAFIRVNLKFLPWYSESAGLQSFRFFLGMVAVSYLTWGFAELSISRRPARGGDGGGLTPMPFLVAGVLISLIALYIMASPPAGGETLRHIRNAEDMVWIVNSVFSLALLIKLLSGVEGTAFYTGFKILAATFAAVIVWKALGFHLRVFEIDYLNPESYAFWHGVQETLEGVAGAGFGAAFLFIFGKLKMLSWS